MSALPLENCSADQVRRDNKRLVLAVEDACAVLGLGCAAGAVGCTSQALRDALDGRNNRRLPVEWAALIAERVGAGAARDAILAAIKSMFGLIEPDSDADYIHRLEQGYAAFGAIGQAELSRHRRESRR